jgi:hypothetical protein
MPEVEGCVLSHLYLSEDRGWGVLVYPAERNLHQHPYPAFYWEPGKSVPTPAERAAALQRLGYEVVSPWVWKESALKPEVHSLYAMAHVRALAAAVPAAADAEAVSA